jgi:acetolactate decarboxylase
VSAGSGAVTLLSPEAVTQFAVLDALLAGAYESGMAVAEVRRRGTFGLGCLDALGGEVVFVDGELFECTTHGPPARLTDAETLPFVDVCDFPEVVPVATSALDLRGLTELVEERLVSRNLFHAVRWDGAVAEVRTRVTPRQRRPFPPLDEVARQQVETITERRRGTLVGFWAPAIYQGITVAGLHLHFLSDDRLVGGHVLDVTVERGDLRLAAFARLHLHLPTDELFLRTELTHGDDHRIVAVEGGVGAR